MTSQSRSVQDGQEGLEGTVEGGDGSSPTYWPVTPRFWTMQVTIMPLEDLEGIGPITLVNLVTLEMCLPDSSLHIQSSLLPQITITSMLVAF